MTTTLAVLATAVSRKRGDLEELAVSSPGTPTTLICTDLVIGGDNEYAGDEVLFLRTPVVVRRVVSSVIATNILTISPALDSLTLAAELFELRQRHLYTDVVAAINSAIQDIAPVAPQSVVPDLSLTTISGQYEYTIPVSFTRLSQVELGMDDAGNFDFLEPLQWGMRSGGKLWIAEGLVDSYPGKTIRLSGYANPAVLATRDATTPIPVPFIIAYCDWYLAGQLVSTAPALLDTLFKTKEFERTRAMTPVKPNTKLVLL